MWIIIEPFHISKRSPCVSSTNKIANHCFSTRYKNAFRFLNKYIIANNICPSSNYIIVWPSPTDSSLFNMCCGLKQHCCFITANKETICPLGHPLMRVESAIITAQILINLHHRITIIIVFVADFCRATEYWQIDNWLTWWACKKALSRVAISNLYDGLYIIIVKHFQWSTGSSIINAIGTINILWGHMSTKLCRLSSLLIPPAPTKDTL